MLADASSVVAGGIDAASGAGRGVEASVMEGAVEASVAAGLGVVEASDVTEASGAEVGPPVLGVVGRAPPSFAGRPRPPAAPVAAASLSRGRPDIEAERTPSDAAASAAGGGVQSGFPWTSLRPPRCGFSSNEQAVSSANSTAAGADRCARRCCRAGWFLVIELSRTMQHLSRKMPSVRKLTEHFRWVERIQVRTTACFHRLYYQDPLSIGMHTRG